jgi:hypothetical protein
MTASGPHAKSGGAVKLSAHGDGPEAATDQTALPTHRRYRLLEVLRIRRRLPEAIACRALLDLQQSKSCQRSRHYASDRKQCGVTTTTLWKRVAESSPLNLVTCDLPRSRLRNRTASSLALRKLKSPGAKQTCSSCSSNRRFCVAVSAEHFLLGRPTWQQAKVPIAF